MAEYVLMHKDIPVINLSLDQATGSIAAIGNVHNISHIPVGVKSKNNRVDRRSLNEWWKGRSIPASRDGLRAALDELNISSTDLLLEKCWGLSLSDQYWICPEGASIGWSTINFFQNSFSEDVGNILFGRRSPGDKLDLMSPDNTSDGWLKKQWKIMNGKRCLVKGGSGATQQEPYNEVIASCIMKRLTIPHIAYELMEQDDYPYSVCENFLNPDTELVTAWYVMQTIQKPNHVSVYQHYKACCEQLGMSSISDSIDQMIVLDYLIANEDRHQNNFGVIRNANTLEYLGVAPVYDSGSSLWFSKPLSMIGSRTKLECKPFKSKHEEQIKLVQSFDWLDLSKLKGIADEFADILSDSLFIDTARKDALCKALNGRINMLEDIIGKQNQLYRIDDIFDDVLKDQAYSQEKK